MIPLIKDAQSSKEYSAWFKLVSSELESHFQLHLEKKQKDWIKQKYRTKIQRFLFPSSHNKCAYCERKPNDGGGYLEIEHIVAKTIDHSLAFSFDNFLPSCKQCNTAKGTKQTQQLLNPYKETSFANHLELDLDTMKIEGKSDSGKETIKTLYKSINLSDFLIEKKMVQGAIISRLDKKKEIDKALCIKQKHQENQSIECLFEELKALIELVDNQKPLTSTYATYLFNHHVFKDMLEHINSNDPKKHEQLTKMIQCREKYCLSVKVFI